MLCLPAQAQQNVQWYMLVLCKVQPETKMCCCSVERNKDNIYWLNSIAKTGKGHIIVRESKKGVNALQILLKKDDVFVHQSGTKDMWRESCKTNASFSGQQSEGSGHICLILSVPWWEVELTGDGGRCWRGLVGERGQHVIHSRHGAVTMISRSV